MPGAFSGSLISFETRGAMTACKKIWTSSRIMTHKEEKELGIGVSFNGVWSALEGNQKSKKKGHS